MSALACDQWMLHTKATTDSASAAINLGFNFSFFGQTYSQAYISSNGLLTFGGGLTNNNNANGNKRMTTRHDQQGCHSGGCHGYPW